MHPGEPLRFRQTRILINRVAGLVAGELAPTVGIMSHPASTTMGQRSRATPIVANVLRSCLHSVWCYQAVVIWESQNFLFSPLLEPNKSGYFA